jgi:hypothetical protein
MLLVRLVDTHFLSFEAISQYSMDKIATFKERGTDILSLMREVTEKRQVTMGLDAKPAYERDVK